MVVVTMEVLQAGVVVKVLDGVVFDGQVTVTRQQVHRETEVTIDDRDGTLIPDEVDALLQPYGTEIRPWHGFKYWDGTVEQVPLGTLRLEGWAGELPRIRLRAYDRNYQLTRARFTSPRTITGSPPVEEVIEQLVREAIPSVVPLEFNLGSTGFDVPSPTVFDEQSTYADAVTQLATNCGCWFRFDPLGVPTLSHEPELDADDPVWSYAEGRDSALLSGSLQRSRDTEGVYNGVVAFSEQAGDNARTFRGEAWDYNPASPTYTERFGRRPTWHQSPLLRSDDQCRAAARKLLHQQLGLSDAISFSGLTNPAHESGDVVYVRRTRAKTDELHILDSFTIPLRGTQTMTAQTRSQRVAA
jgi:hypothetical protein